jgi:hypothetical protein
MNGSTHKPDLLKQNDIISFYHIQMPHWLFADKRYNKISLAAKVAYSLILNRYQLSKLHGWINDAGEVYIIYPRDELAGTLQVGAHKAISIFKELADAGLVWEKRRGNNKANHIYLARVELSDEDATDYDNAPFVPQLCAEDEARSAEYACPDYEPDGETADSTAAAQTPAQFGHAKNAHPEMRKPQPRTCGNDASGSAENACLDMRKPHPSHINSSQKDMSHTELSPSASFLRVRESSDRRTEDEIAELDEILENCELWTFRPETAKVFENAIERLFFTENFKIGDCVLPQQKVRSHLHELNSVRLQTAEQKIARNTEKEIRNTTAYTMAVIFNSIWETESDVMNDPYLNSLRADAPPGDTCEGRR